MGRVYHERVARRKGSLYDERVKKAPLVFLLPALAGCLFKSGEASRIEKVPDELRRPRLVAPRVFDRHPYGNVTKLRAGQWAAYDEDGRRLMLAAVGAEGDAMWIEVIEDGEPRQVSARLVGPDGVVRKAFYGEVSKDGVRSTVEPQPLEQNISSVPARLNETGRESVEEIVTVAGRELKARGTSVHFEDLEGRLTEEVMLWHPDVPPIYAGSDLGGLVRRKSGKKVVALAAFGTDAKSLLEIPR